MQDGESGILTTIHTLHNFTLTNSSATEITHESCDVNYVQFLPLDEAIASRAVFVIVTEGGGRKVPL